MASPQVIFICVVSTVFQFASSMRSAYEEEFPWSTSAEDVLPTSLPKSLVEGLQHLKFKDMALKNLLHYEIVYPEKLNGTLYEELSEISGRKRKRRKRQIETLNHRLDSVYEINAFGHNYTVLLENEMEKEHWISVEYFKEDGDYQKKLVSGDCYKTGDAVDGSYKRMAAISDCDGLTGIIQIPNDFLYIEPLQQKQRNSSVKKAHIIYKLSDIKGYLKNDTTNMLDDFLPAEAEKKGKAGRSRQRRDSYDSFITFVNKAPVEVQIYWVDYRGRKNYFLTLRPNELRGVNTYDRTKWIVYDKTGSLRLLIEGRKDYTSRSNDESERKKLHITAPDGTKFPEDRSENEVTGDEKYIEVLVIADHTVTKHHGRRNVEKYILTFMNIVSRIFKDSSLGIRLNFVVTRIAILERNEPSLKIINKNPSKSVMSACNFATTLQRGGERDKDHFDFAITMTKKSFGPSGYAPVYSMCTSTRSCALVEDDGFTSAFIAAHETGHTLGLEHDGQGGNDCTHDGGKGSVMAALVVSRFDRFFWSKCSRNTIKENIEYFQCLKDKPQAVKLRYSTLLPGAYYTLDEQCESNFKNGYSRCNAFSHNPCRLLWCNVPAKTYYCKTLRGPALDGSACGKDMWCLRGSCVQSDIPITPAAPTTLPPVHGNWGAWSSWTSCSSTCGLGVRHRERKCDYPKPKNGGNDCPGKAKDKSICDQTDCVLMKSFDDSREDQCKMFGGKGWRLYRDGIFQRLLDNKRNTINCTFENGLCNWVNTKVGDEFDWQLNKGKTPSSGTGPDFDHTKGDKEGQYVFIEASDDYKERRRRYDKAQLISPVVRVPRTCFRFYYHMLGRDMGELRIRVQMKGQGQKEVFRQKGDQGKKWLGGEVSLDFDKPFRIIVEAVRGRHYTGDMALDDFSLTAGLCQSEEKARSSCVISCRSGGANRFIMDKQVLDGTKCHSNRSSDICIKGVCVPFGCDKQFGSSKLIDECGVCGGDGSSCAKVSGQKVIRPKNDFEIVLILMPGMTHLKLRDSQKNPYQIGIRRKNSRSLYLKDHRGAANGYYLVGSTTFRYGMSSGKQFITTDGPVKEELEAVLYSPKFYRKSGKSATLNYEYFEVSKSTPSYRYELKGFGPCSKSCGIGKRVSRLQCVRGKDGKVMTNKYCSHLPKPRRYQACNMKPCEPDYKWIIMPWGQCSASCNGGYKSRVVACMKVKGNQVASNRLCPHPIPPNRLECNKKSCDIYRWVTKSWGPCSKSCGGGVKRRRVTCMGVNRMEKVDSLLCTSPQPKDRQPCNNFLCDVFEWTTVKFGVCSKSCGGGTRIRLVYCVNGKTRGRVTPDLCSGPSPSRIDPCNLQPCPEYSWKIGEYGTCSKKCGNGTQTRTISCIQTNSGKAVKETMCKVKKPVSSKPCFNAPCQQHTWEAGPWSNCDAECGRGSQNRTVRCVSDRTGALARAELCRDNVPPSTRECVTQPCSKPADLECNFDEESKFGKWVNSRDDDFDWQIGQFTPSSGTGPLVDHTKGKANGRFAYIEASSPQKYGDKAMLVGPLLDTEEGCFRFWYHMKGDSMGSLTVHLYSKQKKEKIFQKVGNQGNTWNVAEITIKKSKQFLPYRIVIMAIRGQTYSSDAAIDDISMKPRPCGKRKYTPIPRTKRKCREVSPLCVLAKTGNYCKYRSFRQLCCKTCASKLPL